MDIVIIDHQDTLARLLQSDNRSVHFFDDPDTACRFIQTARPALVFVGSDLLEDSAPRYISYLYGLHSPAERIILTAGRLDDERILDCLAMGALGYIEMNDAEKFIEKLINGVLNGEAWISRRLVAKLLQRLQNSREDALTRGLSGE